MDRERLKGIEQSDLTESNINEDFKEWMKTKLPAYLIAVMVLLAGYLFYVNYKEGQQVAHAEAWAEFRNADQPDSLQDVAELYEDVDSIGYMARLAAARQYLASVNRGVKFTALTPSTDPTAPPATDTELTDEERVQYLESAKGLYETILANLDSSAGKSLIAFRAHIGLATIAELQNDHEIAASAYESAAASIEATFPDRAADARARGESLSTLDPSMKLRTLAEIRAVNQKAQEESAAARRRLLPDRDLERYILPDEFQEPA